MGLLVGRWRCANTSRRGAAGFVLLTCCLTAERNKVSTSGGALCRAGGQTSEAEDKLLEDRAQRLDTRSLDQQAGSGQHQDQDPSP